MGVFSKRNSVSAPLLIIKKDAGDANVKEFKSFEEAIVDLENDPNVSVDKIEKLRSSLKNMANEATQSGRINLCLMVLSLQAMYISTNCKADSLQ